MKFNRNVLVERRQSPEKQPNPPQRHLPAANRFAMREALIVLIAFATLVAGDVQCLSAQTESQWATRRRKMVDVAVRSAGVTDARVLKSMSDTRRHEFVPRKFRDRSYLDAGVPIGNKQTISSPFIVAYMTQTLDPKPTDKVLELSLIHI